MKTTSKRWWVLAGVALGCAEAPSAGNAGSQDAVTPAPVSPGTLSEQEKAFSTQFAAVLAEAGTMTAAGLLAEYPSPAKAASLTYDTLAAALLDQITTTLALTDGDRAKLAENGFVVLGRHEATPSTVFHQVYKAHLPLLITSDSLLHALHQSFDTVLKEMEVAALTGTVEAMLRGTHEALGDIATEGPLADAKADLDLYLSVARSLLAGQLVPPIDGALTAGVEAFLGHVAGLRLQNVELFGASRVEDFSQFEPRGHYTESKELERYFKAVMWLGRVDLRFREFDPMSGAPIWNDRQIRAAWMLRAALDAGGARTHWETTDRLIGALMGEVDSLDFRVLDAFVEEAGLDATTAGGDLTDVHAILENGAYGRQRISSHYLATDPFSAEVTPTPIAFTVLGQRYVIDSHVMSNVVYDRIVTPEGQKPQRRLPSSLDAMFVLGHNHALTHLGAELEAWQYAGGLHAIRFLADSHGPEFWENSVYNLWLSGLRELSALPPGAPEAMTTPAWSDKALHTSLGSWAELRHDTILYAKQSYTGGAACEFPDAYVEPYPALYARLGRAASRLADVVATLSPEQRAAMSVDVADWAARWVDATGKLESMAKKQLTDEPFDAAEQALADGWIAEESQGCVMSFTGVYPKLIADPAGITEFDPTIADVHTNPNEDGPLAPAAVLHVGTGWTDVMVFTRDSCEGVKAYVGPTTSFYEVEEPGVARLTDEEWRDRLFQNPALPRPSFTASFLANP